MVVFVLLCAPASLGAQEEPAPLSGDVNSDGVIDVKDVALTMRHILRLASLDEDLLEVADVNTDGLIDVKDVALLMQYSLGLISGFGEQFKLGSEVLLDSKRHLLAGKTVGLVTNQSGVSCQGESTIDLFAAATDFDLVALYGPEHGIDGQAAAGEHVQCSVHPQLAIPVYSLYGPTRMPTEEMLSTIEVLVYDVQDIGARSYTYISTLNYCMVACAKYGIPVIVLDRPNPLGGRIVEGLMLEEPYISFVGVDLLPMAHGMTVGELARFFNRKIGVDLTVVPMTGYSREMIFADTGLSWVKTSPNIPDTEAVFGYMISGMGEGTGFFQAEQFKWLGGKGLNAEEYAAALNKAGLPGVKFLPQWRGEAGGAKILITDYRLVNPAKTGIWALAIAFELADFNIPVGADQPVMFELIMGGKKMGEYLKKGLTPEQIETNYAPALDEFKEERKKYLLSQYGF